MKFEIRKVNEEDTIYLKEVLDTSELFPSEMLDDMVYDYFKNKKSKDLWFTAVVDSIPIGIAYVAPERMTNGTMNLYAIAVHRNHQGNGIGSSMMNYIEKELRSKETRILLVETSGLSEYELTRKFYDKCEFTREAVIRDFYQEGEDKILFWKKL